MPHCQINTANSSSNDKRKENYISLLILYLKNIMYLKKNSSFEFKKNISYSTNHKSIGKFLSKCKYDTELLYGFLHTVCRYNKF